MNAVGKDGSDCRYRRLFNSILIKAFYLICEGGYQDCELPSVEVLENSEASSPSGEEESLPDSSRVSEIDQVAGFWDGR